MLETIPSPPPPALPAEISFPVAGAAFLVGLLLVLWGRKLHRPFLVLVGAGAGFLVAPLLTAQLGMAQHENAVRFVAVFALAILGLVLARVLWALLAGALGTLAAAAGISYRMASLVLEHRPADFQWPAQGLEEWASSVCQYFAAWIAALVQVLPPMMFVFAAACVAVPLLIVLVWPRLGVIVMTSLVGAGLAVAGVCLAGVQARADLWATLGGHWPVLAAAAGVLMLLGWVVQGRSALKQAKARREQESQEPSDKPPAKPAPAADKKAKASPS